MKDTIRTFIAIKINPEKKLSELRIDLKNSLKGEEIRWVDANNLHLTLCFLGETNPVETAEIANHLESIAAQFQPFQFELKDLMLFKNKSMPRVLFLSVKNDSVISTLAHEIQRIIKAMGFRVNENTFHPHVTLARMKYIENKDVFYSLVNKYNDVIIQTVVVSEIIFYQSILSSSGPVYKPLEIFKFM